MNMEEEKISVQNELSDALAPDSADRVPELAMLQADEERRIAAKLLPALTSRIATEVKIRLEADNAIKLQAQIDGLIEQNKKIVEAELKKIQESAKPLDRNDIQKLLDQEYIEFTLRVQGEDGPVDFIISELPMSVEMRLVKTIEKKIVPALRGMEQLDFSGRMDEKLQRIIDVLPGGLEVVAELASICLDPWQKKNINADWVTRHLSSYRIVQVLTAQMEAGRMRDFFLGVYRLIPGQTVA